MQQLWNQKESRLLKGCTDDVLDTEFNKRTTETLFEKEETMSYKGYARQRRAIRLLCILGFAIGFIAAEPCAQAQDYLIGNGVFGNGGGETTGSSYAINGTVGQPIMGVSSNASYTITSGVCHDISGILWTDVSEELTQVSTLPSQYKLEQNYPNPFNPTTTIRFTLPKQSQVTLKLYNILGQVVATLVDENLLAGEYEVTLNAEGLSSGLYFYQLVAQDFTEYKKLVLLK